MAALWRNRMSLLEQYQTAIDRFEKALRDCPEGSWEASLWKVKRTDRWIWPSDGEPGPERTDQSIQVFSEFWYIAHHCLFHLDFYLSGPDTEGFAPPPAIGEDEGLDEHMAAVLPSRVYTRTELLGYLAQCRRKAGSIIPALTEQETKRVIPQGHPWAGHNYNTLLRVNLNHVKEHGGQMRRFLEKARAR